LYKNVIDSEHWFSARENKFATCDSKTILFYKMRKTAQLLPCLRLSAGIAPHPSSGSQIQEYLISAVLPTSCLYQDLPDSKILLENLLVSSVKELRAACLREKSRRKTSFWKITASFFKKFSPPFFLVKCSPWVSLAELANSCPTLFLAKERGL
jgi:hypothetical protein